MTRARHEHQIRLLDTYSGEEFEQALARVCQRHRGTFFFTDEQIAELREEMILANWQRQSSRANRKNAAAHMAMIRAACQPARPDPIIPGDIVGQQR